MLICKDCESDWGITGKSWQRLNGRWDHRCNCGSKKSPEIHYTQTSSRVLVIPDTHYPFAKAGHLEFLRSIYDKYDCNEVIHLGDIIDNHASSYHESDPDLPSAGDELESAMLQLGRLHALFPKMKVCSGNHCSLPKRKGKTSGLSGKWIKSIKDVLIDHGIDAWYWEFADHFVIDGVKYCHGVGRQAKQRMIQDGLSVVQGHWHARSSVEWHVNDFVKTFAVQLGALVDDDSRAMAYGKHFAKSHKNCGVIIDGTPLIEYMEL